MNRKKLFLSLLKKLAIDELIQLDSKFTDNVNLPKFEDIGLMIPGFKEHKISYELALEDFYKTEEYLEINNINPKLFIHFLKNL